MRDNHWSYCQCSKYFVTLTETIVKWIQYYNTDKMLNEIVMF